MPGVVLDWESPQRPGATRTGTGLQVLKAGRPHRPLEVGTAREAQLGGNGLQRPVHDAQVISKCEGTEGGHHHAEQHWP